MNTPKHSIEALCERSHAISVEKGWVTEGGDSRPFATITALNHTELSEAFEDYRNNKPLTEVWYEVKMKTDGTVVSKTMSSAEKAEAEKHDGKFGRGDVFVEAKPCGIPIELADFVIRVCQHVGTAGKARKFDELFEARNEIDIHPDLDTLIAEVHLSVSLAYNAKKYQAGSDHYLEDLAEGLCEVFAFCDANKIDLWAAIDEKEAFNRTRPIRHGGKKV